MPIGGGRCGGMVADEEPIRLYKSIVGVEVYWSLKLIFILELVVRIKQKVQLQ
jgi:hypothetical protein